MPRIKNMQDMIRSRMVVHRGPPLPVHREAAPRSLTYLFLGGPLDGQRLNTGGAEEWHVPILDPETSFFGDTPDQEYTYRKWPLLLWDQGNEPRSHDLYIPKYLATTEGENARWVIERLLAGYSPQHAAVDVVEEP